MVSLDTKGAELTRKLSKELEFACKGFPIRYLNRFVPEKWRLIGPENRFNQKLGIFKNR